MRIVLKGNTIRVTTKFYDMDDEVIAPEEVTLTIYDGRWNVVETAELIVGDDMEYSFDYIMPPDLVNPISIEVKGIVNGYPTIERKAVMAKKLRD